MHISVFVSCQHNNLLDFDILHLTNIGVKSLFVREIEKKERWSIAKEIVILYMK